MWRRCISPSLLFPSLLFPSLLIVAAVMLFQAGPVCAQQVTGVTILESGVFSALTVRGPSERTFGSNYKLVKSGTSFDHTEFQDSQFEDGNPRVGFWWVLDGRPNGSEVTVTTIQKNPDGRTYNTPWPVTIGEKTWNGTKVGDWDGYVGPLVIEIWYRKRKLGEMTFNIQ